MKTESIRKLIDQGREQIWIRPKKKLKRDQKAHDKRDRIAIREALKNR